MSLAHYLLAVLLADNRLEGLKAYEDCRRARETSKVWVVGVAGAVLRAREAPDSPALSTLEPGQEVAVLKVTKTQALVKSREGMRGWLPGEALIAVSEPPRDTAPADSCQKPSLGIPLGPYVVPPPPPPPTPEELKSLELDEKPPSPGGKAKGRGLWR